MHKRLILGIAHETDCITVDCIAVKRYFVQFTANGIPFQSPHLKVWKNTHRKTTFTAIKFTHED